MGFFLGSIRELNESPTPSSAVPLSSNAPLQNPVRCPDKTLLHDRAPNRQVSPYADIFRIANFRADSPPSQDGPKISPAKVGSVRHPKLIFIRPPPHIRIHYYFFLVLLQELNTLLSSLAETLFFRIP